ncbi:MAG: glycerophosphodiester phosphodiesterase [Niabella sp.]
MKKYFLWPALIMLLVATTTLNAQVRKRMNNKYLKTDLPRPQKVNNNVVAHRGGSLEKGCPDNSIEALTYAIGLGCYASECDVYLTKDNRVIVAHADENDKINGFHPWEATFDEIVNAAKLENGEVIPSLEEYLKHVLDAGTTILWIDVKFMSSIPASRADELASKCIEVSSDIIRKMHAQNFVEVITPRKKIHISALQGAKGEWQCGLMDTHFSPEQFKEEDFNWANFYNTKVFYHDGMVKGVYSIEDYLKKGIKVSIYHVDSEKDKEYYISKIKKLHALTTNYPAALLMSIKASAGRK